MKIYIRKNLMVLILYSRSWYFVYKLGQTSDHLTFEKSYMHYICGKEGVANKNKQLEFYLKLHVSHEEDEPHL